MYVCYSEVEKSKNTLVECLLIEVSIFIIWVQRKVLQSVGLFPFMAITNARILLGPTDANVILVIFNYHTIRLYWCQKHSSFVEAKISVWGTCTFEYVVWLDWV